MLSNYFYVNIILDYGDLTHKAVLLTLGLLCPGSIFLGLVNISAITFLLNPWISLASHSVLILIFIVTCFLAPTRVQVNKRRHIQFIDPY